MPWYFAAASQIVSLPLVTLVIAGIVVRDLQRRPRRRRDVPAGVRRRGVLERGDRRCARCFRRRSTTRGSRCRARPAWPRCCRFFDGQHVRGQAARFDRFVSHLVDREPRDRARRPVQAPHRANRDGDARRVRGDRVDDRGRQVGAGRSIDDSQERTHHAGDRARRRGRRGGQPVLPARQGPHGHDRRHQERATSKPSCRPRGRFNRSAWSTSAPTRRAASSTSRSTRAIASRQGQFLLQIDPRSLRTRVDSGTASLQAAADVARSDAAGDRDGARAARAGAADAEAPAGSLEPGSSRRAKRSRRRPTT